MFHHDHLRHGPTVRLTLEELFVEMAREGLKLTERNELIRRVDKTNDYHANIHHE